MNDFFLCNTSDMEVNSSRPFVLPDGTTIVLFYTKSGYYAVENRCPHAGASLVEGRIKKDILMCVWHGWKFNLKTKACLTDPDARLKAFSLNIKGGKIYLRLNADFARE